MNINLSNSFFNEVGQGIKQNHQIDKQQMSPVNEVSSKDVLTNLLTGDVFGGKIMDIQGHNVSILINSTGQKLDATMLQAFDFNIGDQLIFQMKDKTDNQVVLRPIANQDISMDLVRRSLDVAGLGETDKNVAIVKELIARELPIDKNSIQNMLRLTSNYGTESIDKIADMVKNHIEVNEETLKQYDNYMSTNYQLSEELAHTADAMLTYMEQEAKHPEEAVKLLDVLSQTLEELNELPAQQEQLTAEGELNEQMQTDHYAIKPENHMGEIEHNENGKEAVWKETVWREVGEATSFSELKQVLEKKMEKGLDLNEIKELFHSDEWKNKVRQFVQKELSIPVDSLEKEDMKAELKHIYDKMLKLSNQLEQGIFKSPELKEQGKNIRNNVNFLNELNYNYSFVQIPLSMSNGRANGDLYVYNRKKQWEKQETLTAFLHLELDYLGATDVYIQMSQMESHPRVSTKFTLENEESMELVEAHLHELTKRLEKQGYTVSVQTETALKHQTSDENHETYTNYSPMNVMNATNPTAVRVKRYTFDIRT